MQLYDISKAINSFVMPVYHVMEYTICMYGSIHGLANIRYVSRTL